MKRVLVFGMTENPGGIESFLLNVYRHIDRDKIQFDFLCNSHEPVAYEKELIQLGGKCYHITARSKNICLFRQELKNIFDTHASEWSAIWVNVCSLANIDYIKYAKKYGIKKRIIHSHNSQNMDGKIRGMLHWWNKQKIGHYATDFWACSDGAMLWFYPPQLHEKVLIIHNAIEVKRFVYDEIKRKKIRDGLGVKNEYVIGNVGRLHFQKNQFFLLDIFHEFLNICPDSKLVLIGQGEDEQRLKEKCKHLEMENKVVFAGVQKDVGAWLSAFDLFLFPSIFEGLSVVALEAQANGVPVLASDGVIQTQVRMNENFVFYGLDNSAKIWAEKIVIIKKALGRENQNDIFKIFAEKGYDISTEVNKIEKLLCD